MTLTLSQWKEIIQGEESNVCTGIEEQRRHRDRALKLIKLVCIAKPPHAYIILTSFEIWTKNSYTSKSSRENFLILLLISIKTNKLQVTLLNWCPNFLKYNKPKNLWIWMLNFSQTSLNWLENQETAELLRKSFISYNRKYFFLF